MATDTWGDTMVQILGAMTWTLNTTQPQTNLQGVKSGARTVAAADSRIDLFPETGQIVLASNGTKIYEEQRGRVEIHARNTANRNNINTDLQKGMPNSGFPFNMEAITPRNKRNHRVIEYRMKITVC